MRRADLVVVAGDDANPGAVGGPEPARCDEFRPTLAPAGVLVMIEDGRVARISVSRSTDITSPAGFRVGDSGTDIVKANGARAQVSDHQYWPPSAKYIVLWDPTSRPERGVLYEVNDKDKVVFMRAGGPSIQYLEGCA